VNADDFKKSTGYEATQDDLERANCDKAGQIGHQACGICRHGEPRFTCVRCLQEIFGRVK
jgi:hypothetical protein